MAVHFQSQPSRSRIAHEGARFFRTPVHAQAVCDTIWEGQGLNTFHIENKISNEWTLGDPWWSFWSLILDDAWFLLLTIFLGQARRQCISMPNIATLSHPWMQRPPSQAGGVKQAFSSCPQSTGQPSFFGRQSNVPRFKAQHTSEHRGELGSTYKWGARMC